MAIILDSPFGTRVATRPRPVGAGTTPQIDPEDSGLPPEPPNGALPPREPGNGKTSSVVSEEDKGDIEPCDSPVFPQSAAGVPSALSTDERRKLAGRLDSLMNRVIESHGKVSMAANLQLLKRELSRCHDVLGALTYESDYLSIVTLVEANLASMDWKSATKQQLRQVEQALAVGCAESSVTFDDYTRAARRLRGSGLPTMPSFELGTEEEDAGAP
jgi:hypothetical protein